MEPLCDARRAGLLLAHGGAALGALAHLPETSFCTGIGLSRPQALRTPKTNAQLQLACQIHTFKAKVRLQHSTASLTFLPEYLYFFARSLMHLK